MEKIFHANGNHKKLWLVIKQKRFLSKKKKNCYKRPTKTLYIDKRIDLSRIYTIMNLFMLCNRAPKYRKQTFIELRSKTGSSTIIVGNVKISLLIIREKHLDIRAIRK